MYSVVLDTSHSNLFKPVPEVWDTSLSRFLVSERMAGVKGWKFQHYYNITLGLGLWVSNVALYIWQAPPVCLRRKHRYFQGFHLEIGRTGVIPLHQNSYTPQHRCCMFPPPSWLPHMLAGTVQAGAGTSLPHLLWQLLSMLQGSNS